jgi:hypothetical protein
MLPTKESPMRRPSILARAIALCAACLVTAVLVYVHGVDLDPLRGQPGLVASQAAPAGATTALAANRLGAVTR